MIGASPPGASVYSHTRSRKLFSEARQKLHLIKLRKCLGTWAPVTELIGKTYPSSASSPPPQGLPHHHLLLVFSLLTRCFFFTSGEEETPLTSVLQEHSALEQGSPLSLCRTNKEDSDDKSIYRRGFQRMAAGLDGHTHTHAVPCFLCSLSPHIFSPLLPPL